MTSFEDRRAGGREAVVPSPGDRRARAATAVVFFVTGFVVAAWATRIPAVQDRLGLSPGTFALAVAGLEAGALAGLPAGGVLVARLGSRPCLRLGFAVYPTALLGVALAPGLAWLTAALAVMAAANSVVDVAMNAQGVELERRYRRPILSGLHAAHPMGMLAGGLAGTAAAAAGLAATRHLAVEPRQPGQALLARPGGRLLLLGTIAFCAFLLDGAASNWSAAHLHDEHAASPALAAAGFSAFTAALALARLAGDRLIARLGRLRVVQASGLLAATGATVVATASTAPLALLGWATLGAGLATIAPAVLGAAPTASQLPPPVAIAAVTTLGYLGSFTGPPLVGVLAELTGLSTALALLVAAAILPVLLARRALSRACGDPSSRPGSGGSGRRPVWRPGG
jgi:MFS family permease